MEINKVLDWLTLEQIIEISAEMGSALNYMKEHEKIPESIYKIDYATPLYLFAKRFGLVGADREYGHEESNAIFSVMKFAYEKLYEELK